MFFSKFNSTVIRFFIKVYVYHFLVMGIKIKFNLKIFFTTVNSMSVLHMLVVTTVIQTRYFRLAAAPFVCFWQRLYILHHLFYLSCM